MNQSDVANPIPEMMLAQDEKVVASLEVKASLLFPFKSAFVVTDRRFGGNYRKGMFSSDQFQFPLNNVASVGVGTGVAKGALIWGAILVATSLFWLAFYGEGAQMLLALLIGVWGVLSVFSAFKTQAQVTNNAGQTLLCQVNLFEKARAKEFFNLVNREVAEASYGAR